MLNIGFIGLGGMGRTQVGAFAQTEGCRLYAGADPSESARDEVSRMRPEMKTFADHRAMLEDDGVDAVVVATPTAFHPGPTIDALEAGKPVLVEKPMARTTEDCRSMIAASRASGKPLMVAHCRRFDAIWGAWAEIVRAGRIGSPVVWRRATANVMGGWFMDEQIGRGPMLDGAIHDYDFANSIFGDPESVVASSTKLNPEVSAVDTATAVVQYAGGSQLVSSWTWARKGDALFDVLGPCGSIVCREGRFTLINPEGEETPIETPDEVMAMYRHQARHFLECARGETECVSPATEAIKAVAVAEAIIEVAPAGGSRPVSW